MIRKVSMKVLFEKSLWYHQPTASTTLGHPIVMCDCNTVCQPRNFTVLENIIHVISKNKIRFHFQDINAIYPKP